ncbi:MAG: HAD family hydrolase [Geminicoccaceae bacterium]
MLENHLIIFDLDGVIVDSEPIAARIEAEMLREAGLTIDEREVLKRFLGRSEDQMRRSVEIELGRPLHEDFTAELRSRVLAAFENELLPIPGIAAVLRRLTGPRCVASSSALERIRTSLKIADLFSQFSPHLFSASMVERGKPAPDLFRYAASQMGIPIARCIVIEDSTAGVRAGKAANMTVFGFVGGSHLIADQDGDRLREAGADVVFDRMSDLPRLLAARVADVTSA